MEYIEVAWIQNTHGIKGELKIRPCTDFPKIHFQKGKKLYLDKTLEVEIQMIRQQKDLFLIQFKDYEDINLVETWKSKSLFIPLSQQVVLSQGEFYRHQLIGLNVISEKGEQIGVVLAVEETLGAQNNLRIQGETQQILYPFLKDFVQQVSLEKKEIQLSRWEEFK